MKPSQVEQAHDLMQRLNAVEAGLRELDLSASEKKPMKLAIGKPCYGGGGTSYPVTVHLTHGAAYAVLRTLRDDTREALRELGVEL